MNKQFLTSIGFIFYFLLLQIIESHFDVDYNIRVYILVTAVPIFLVGIVRNMKYLVPFSALANILLLVGFCLTFYYIFQDLPPLSSRPAVAPITQIPLFFSTVLFGMEGIGTVLALLILNIVIFKKMPEDSMTKTCLIQC